MTLPVSGPISMTDLSNEFLVNVRTPLSKYLRGGIVPDYGDNPAFPNSNVPKAPPVALTDFYGGERTGNPFQGENILLPASQQVASIAFCGRTRDEALYVPPHDPARSEVPEEGRFVVEAKFRLTDDFRKYYYPNDNNTQDNIRSYFRIGLTALDPLLYSDQFMEESMKYFCYLNFGTFQVDRLNLFRKGIFEDPWDDTDYDDYIRPDETHTCTVRVRRYGPTWVDREAGRYIPYHYLTIHRSNDNSQWHGKLANQWWPDQMLAGGWLAVANATWPNQPSNIYGEPAGVGIELEYLRGVVGTGEAPW